MRRETQSGTLGSRLLGVTDRGAVPGINALCLALSEVIPNHQNGVRDSRDGFVLASASGKATMPSR